MNLKEKVIKQLQKQTEKRIIKKLKDLPEPPMLKNCNLAAKEIIQTLYSGRRILIVGDYDCDGIVATTVLFEFLKDSGFSNLVDFIIPSRLKDGYGLSKNIIDYAIENMYDFIVTVDNGISAFDSIEYANENNIEVIITDHHTAPEILPNAKYIVNPRVKGETFPFPYISGATVAWYLVAALKQELNSTINIAKYLDLVAITVISDVMPLNDINLALLDFGLKKIKNRERLIYQLVWNDWTAPTINETAIAFNFVPMINAIGRINDANIGVNMFISKDRNTIQNYYNIMKEINENRKEMSREYLKEAEKYLLENHDTSNSVLVVRNKNFHEGIVGIIAGKLAEKYSKPAYVFSYNKENKIWKGSGRTHGDIHLYDLTNSASKYILGFGGHKGAVGLAVEENNFENFEKEILKAGNKIPDIDFVDKNKVVFNAELKDFNMELLKTIESFYPFGNDNPLPVFQFKANVKILREIKNGLHYSVELKDGDITVPGIFFNVEKENFLKSVKNELNLINATISKNYNAKEGTFSFQLISEIID